MVTFAGLALLQPTANANAQRDASGMLSGVVVDSGAGMGIVGLVTSPMLGKIADQKAHERFVAEQPAVVSTLGSARDALRAKLPSVPADQQPDVQKSIDLTDKVVTSGASGSLPPIETANAMRSIIGTGVQDPAARPRGSHPVGQVDSDGSEPAEAPLRVRHGRSYTYGDRSIVTLAQKSR